MFNAKILCDSINQTTEARLTTMELTFPRIVLAEWNTHRAFSRNAASSRAIPVSKMIKDVKENPFIPIHWGKNQKGMQANEVLIGDAQRHCEEMWVEARDRALDTVEGMVEIGLHKQIANRLLEPWMWVTVIGTGNAGAWNNFFALRCHPEAEPHIQKIAYMARDEIKKSNPQTIIPGGWHLPLIGFPGDEFLFGEDKIKVSVGRCARVSYLTHSGVRDVQADIELHDRLQISKHFSPFEHVAQYTNDVNVNLGGNFGRLWIQYRKTLKGEFQSHE